MVVKAAQPSGFTDNTMVFSGNSCYELNEETVFPTSMVQLVLGTDVVTATGSGSGIATYNVDIQSNGGDIL